MDTSNINRIEVIDHTPPMFSATDDRGRVYSKWDDSIKVELDIQDQGRTLKVFISKRI